MNTTLKIAIQKSGRISEPSQKLLRDIGLNFEPYERQLVTKCSNENINLLFVRDDDIPKFVESGVADIGIVGSDEVKESDTNVSTERALGFGRCNLSVAKAKDSTIRDIKGLDGKRIATSFPNITKDYLVKNQINADIVEISGSVEIAPLLGLSDAIVDLVSSGFTLEVNGLSVMEKIMSIETLLISTPDLPKEKRVLVNKLISRIDSLKAASKYKYILINIPEKNITDLKSITPGLKSPTISKLDKKGWVSAQTVIQEDKFWTIIDDIKKIGGTDILVTPIEKLIL